MRALTPSSRALCEVLLAWLAWPGRTPDAYEAWCKSGCADQDHGAMFALSGKLHDRGLIDMNAGTLLRRGQDLIDAVKASSPSSTAK